MTISGRVIQYKRLFGNECKAVEPVRRIFKEGMPTHNELVYLEALRELNTELSELYEVSIPTITCWVRDYSYVQQTGDIYLTEPNVWEFLHQYRHHLQNVARKYENKGLLTEGNIYLCHIPYQDTVHKMLGEDDARAWCRMVLELALGV